MKTLAQIPVKFFLVFFFLMTRLSVYGQTEEKIVATAKTSLSEDVLARTKEIKSQKKSHRAYIVTANIRNIGYGNKCVTEATRKMGFVYVPMPANEIERKSTFYYFTHNQMARLKVTLKNGPFWQGKLKKNIKRCRQTTGDFTG